MAWKQTEANRNVGTVPIVVIGTVVELLLWCRVETGSLESKNVRGRELEGAEHIVWGCDKTSVWKAILKCKELLKYIEQINFTKIINYDEVFPQRHR
jgi:hypothetical protein